MSRHLNESILPKVTTNLPTQVQTEPKRLGGELSLFPSHASIPLDIAVLIPCRNEEPTIGKVVRDFRRALPGASIYVYDNGSTDLTAQVAREAGAIVRYVPLPGKGNVLRRMFGEVDASVYVLVDGDDTYDASVAPELVIRLYHHHLDMVVGRRVEAEAARHAYRRGHRFGNRLLTRSARWVFGVGPQDMLSGYRVFSRRYVKSFPAASRGFEAETEMTIHALELKLPFDEVPTRYGDRQRDSASKLKTIPDGLRIMKFIALLCKDYRPFRFFGPLGLLSGVLAFGLAWFADPQRQSAFTVATTALFTLALLLILAALILDSLGRTRRETKRMLYLAVSPTRASGAAAPNADGVSSARR